MKKIFTAATCALLSAALVTPALADHKLGGYFRTQMYMQSQTLAKDPKPARFVDNRIRARWQNNINEYVSIVWYVEADTPWGETSKGGIGGGGKVGADGVNVETKNAFASIKIPDTPVSAVVGIQGFGDNFHSLLLNDDMAGLKLDAKLGMADVTAFWSKWIENSRTAEDDVDLYWVEGNLKPMDKLTVGLTGAWLRDQPNNSDNYYIGVDGGFKLDIIDLDGFFLYNFGTNEDALPGGKDQDISAWALSLNAKAKVDIVKVGAGLLVVGADDDKDDDMSLNGGYGAFEFYDAGLQIFLADVYYNNGAGGRHALTDAGFAGYGLVGLWANGAMDLPALKGAYVKGALGYFMAMDDKRNDEAVASKEGTQLGFEIGAQVGIKIADAADVSLRGAYAVLGDFYDAPAGGSDPDDLYQVVLMLNVPY